jgi:hypothetical protein
VLAEGGDAPAAPAAPEPAPSLDFTDLIKHAAETFDAEQLPDEH